MCANGRMGQGRKKQRWSKSIEIHIPYTQKVKWACSVVTGSRLGWRPSERMRRQWYTHVHVAHWIGMLAKNECYHKQMPYDVYVWDSTCEHPYSYIYARNTYLSVVEIFCLVSQLWELSLTLPNMICHYLISIDCKSALAEWPYQRFEWKNG